MVKVKNRMLSVSQKFLFKIYDLAYISFVRRSKSVRSLEVVLVNLRSKFKHKESNENEGQDSKFSKMLLIRS